MVAAAGILLASRTPYSAPASTPGRELPVRDPGYRPVYLVIGLSGLCALGAEVIWTRLLSLLLGGTVYTFSIILAVFLTGLGIGSSAGSFLARTAHRPRVVLGWCQLLLTGGDRLGRVHHYPIHAVLVDKSPAFAESLVYIPARSPAVSGRRSARRRALGSEFPPGAGVGCLARREPGRLVGEVYAANTFGAILGAIGFSMLVIPQAGTQQAQRLIVGLSGAAALTMFASLFRAAGMTVLSGLRSGTAALRLMPVFRHRGA